MIFDFRDAKCILFASFGKAYRPKNAIFAAYLSIGTDALFFIFRQQYSDTDREMVS